MKLQPNEFTVSSYVAHLNKKYGAKVSGEPFKPNDVYQYLLRGYIPYHYGKEKITAKKIEGVKIITMVKG